MLKRYNIKQTLESCLTKFWYLGFLESGIYEEYRVFLEACSFHCWY